MVVWTPKIRYFICSAYFCSHFLQDAILHRPFKRRMICIFFAVCHNFGETSVSISQPWLYCCPAEANQPFIIPAQYADSDKVYKDKGIIAFFWGKCKNCVKKLCNTRLLQASFLLCSPLWRSASDSRWLLLPVPASGTAVPLQFLQCLALAIHLTPKFVHAL